MRSFCRLPARTAPRLAALGASQQAVAAALDRQRFEGEASSASEQFIDDDGNVRRLLVVGTGDGEHAGESAEKLGGTAAARLQTSGETTAVIDLTGLGYDADAAARVGLGAALRSWRYDRYRTKLKDKQKPTLEEVVIVGGGCRRGAALRAALGAGRRRRVADPRAGHRAGQHHLPGELRRARPRVARGQRASRSRCSTARRWRSSAWARCSASPRARSREARLLVLKWNGGGKGGQPTAFVGKGVTFDTGGISIKPAAGMEDMKWDMGGAGAVAGAMKALAPRKAKANVVGICGLVENMPDGNAQRPGDVVTTMSGQTIEVINTDAEGRLVLCDAITWVQRNFKPTTIIDLATLTGAMIISLGHEWAGLFSNDDELAAELLRRPTNRATSCGACRWRSRSTS